MTHLEVGEGANEGVATGDGDVAGLRGIQQWVGLARQEAHRQQLGQVAHGLCLDREHVELDLLPLVLGHHHQVYFVVGPPRELWMIR